MHPTSSPEFIVVCWENIILKSTASARSRIGVVNKCLFWIIHVWIIMTFTELLSIFQKNLCYLTYNLNKSHKYITYYFHNFVAIKAETKFGYKTFLRLEAHIFNWAFLRQTHMLVRLLWIQGKFGSRPAMATQKDAVSKHKNKMKQRTLSWYHADRKWGMEDWDGKGWTQRSLVYSPAIDRKVHV